MKKILYLIIAVFVGGFTLFACSDDDDDKNPLVDTNPGKDAEGTYSGIYTRIQDDGTETTTSGKIIISSTDNPYVAYVEYVADTEIWSNEQLASVANITSANDGFQFHNVITTNAMGIAFYGSIDSSGNINSYFQLTVSVDNIDNIYDYYFEGKKN